MNHKPDPHDVLLPIHDPNALPAGRTPMFWRSLDELAGEDSFQEYLEREFPGQAEQWRDIATRRRFLQLMGASLALSGIAGCAVQPIESIVPNVEQPELIVPGKPLFFATAAPLNGFGTGVLVASHMGRPIKIEGNPAHPTSLGATDSFSQAAILSLYDPDRSQVVLNNGLVNTWERFLALAVDVRQQKRRNRGRGLRLLTPSVTSPTLADQIQRLLKQFPEAKWHSYEPLTRDSVRLGTSLAFGAELEPIYHIEKADIVLALDADFLGWGPDKLRHAHDFASRREIRGAQGGATGSSMARLYVVECTPSITGAMADHRTPLSARKIAPFAMALARSLKVEGLPPGGAGEASDQSSLISALVRDLEDHRGKSLVVPGDTQPPAVHALAHAMNHALGSIGTTVTYHPSPEQNPTGQIRSLVDLTRDINRGLVDTLLILDANPVYDAPTDLDFAAALTDEKIKLRVHLGLYADETAERCHWHIPQAHFLEAWSDIRAVDGTVTVQQPLIAPLYQGKSPHDVLAVFLGEPDRPGLEIVREHWKQQALPGDFETAWQKALRDGSIAGTASTAKTVALKPGGLTDSTSGADQGEGGMELVFRPDPTVWDGRFANSGWLQELPKPLTRLTWDNAALISHAQARRLNISEGDIVELRYQGRTLQIPAWIMPGQADDTVTVSLGYGRWKSGRVGTGAGFNAYALRTSSAPWFGGGLELVKTGDVHALATVQHHHTMAGRDLVRVATVEEFLQNPTFAQPHGHQHGQSLYPDPPRGQNAENAWGMAIDLNRCIGCGACVVACQAENNIPIVGKDEVLRSREMHWLRIDRYYEGEDAASPKTYFQPVACMHCEKAPCEPVCPVGATTHSDEGLNEMTYNRCVGTRYCSNNCPYKVRRFNFLQYSDETTPSLKLMRNPDVTVRTRGIMEKCTYCVQRINHARITAKTEDRPVGGDEVVTACQAACPARAIVFGNLNDPQSTVAQAKASPRNYGLLAELNTWPRTSYLARLRNPNPDLESTREDRSEPRDGNRTS
jgi:molybdopterin-containing oxidoreductase family iron-sulfur binding subunit